MSVKLGKIVTFEEVKEQAKALKKADKKIVFTNGCFDILHRGHADYLLKARNCGDVLILGMNSDSSVKKLKGESRPLNNQEDRGYLLASLKAVDYVVIFSEDTPTKLIEAIKPDVLAKGADYTVETVVGAEFVQSYGGEIALIPLVDGKSTTNLVGKIQAG